MNIKKLIFNVTKKTGRIPMNIIYRLPFIASKISDEVYLKLIYRCCMGEKLNLDNPIKFNEKLQWLKLNDRKEEYTNLVDKYEVKKYISNKIGEKFVIPNIGVWDNFESIDFSELPEKFVLKCTHDSGKVVICRDKKQFNKEKARKVINKALKSDFYLTGREWPYKNVKRRIIAEQYMENESRNGLMDYKFYCFDGEPKYLYVSAGLEDHSTARVCFYDMEFKRAPFGRSDFLEFEENIEKPINFEKMKEIASILSKGHPFLRVDLYEINGQIYFSELTFTPCTGLMPFKPKKYDEILGNMLKLPNK